MIGARGCLMGFPIAPHPEALMPPEGRKKALAHRIEKLWLWACLAICAGPLLVVIGRLKAEELKAWPGPSGQTTAEPAAPSTTGGPIPKSFVKPAAPKVPSDDAFARCVAGCDQFARDGYQACGEDSVLPTPPKCRDQIASAAGVCRAGCHGR
jgi:hypothetical protein